MPYPTFEQYNQAFQAHDRLLADPELRAGTLATTSLGLPLAISGGFALTYTIATKNGKFAVRCFHREAKGLERRYAAISKRLEALRSPYFLPFKFDPRGITVEGKPQPIVKMAWAQGTTLGEFLEANHANTSALAKLAAALDALATYLEREGISHGDLQTGNLMVSAGGATIQLIDYDGMYVADIKDLGSAELGHINFQHPKRAASNPFGPGLDRFSLISLGLAIKALRTDPSIWARTKSEAEAIVFRANDFADPEASDAFSALASNPALLNDAKNFAAICKAPIGSVPTLADFLAGKSIPSVALNISSTPRPSSSSARYASPYAVVSAEDFEACLRLVGDRVEVIGKIIEVKHNRARNGNPYVFINFGPWRGRIFKVSIWSKGLAALKSAPEESWAGKWISVVGLMEPPYTNNRFKYSHLSINVESGSQLTLIPEAEALWRLGKGGAPAGARADLGNKRVIEKIQGKATPSAPSPAPRSAAPTPARQPAPPPPPPPPPPRTANQQILANIRGAQPSAAGAPPPPPRSMPPGGHAYKPPPAPATAKGAGYGGWLLLALAAVVLFVLFGFSRSPSRSAPPAPIPPVAALAAPPKPAASAPLPIARAQEKSVKPAEARPKPGSVGPYTPEQANYCGASILRFGKWSTLASPGWEPDARRVASLRADIESRCNSITNTDLAPALSRMEPHRDSIYEQATRSWRALSAKDPPIAASAPSTDIPATAERAAASEPSGPPASQSTATMQAPSASIAATRPDAPDATGIPKNAHLNKYGGGWLCDKGFVSKGSECAAVQIPANARLDYTGSSWVCNRGFVSLGVECAPIEIPANARLDYSGHGWVCNPGFVLSGASCSPVQIPPNARLDFTGHGWVCARGYSRLADQCVEVRAPTNAQLDYSGSGWVCSRGFARVADSCEALRVPANATLDYSGNRWNCQPGFRQSGAECVPR